MKKLLSVILLIFIACSFSVVLSSCGDKENDPSAVADPSSRHDISTDYIEPETDPEPSTEPHTEEESTTLAAVVPTSAVQTTSSAEKTTAKIETTQAPTTKKQTSNNGQVDVNDNTADIVYITPTGKKFHRSSCRTIKGECSSISRSSAIARGYGACKVCSP